MDQLDGWLRGDFVRINTALEEKYFAERMSVIGGRADVDGLKKELLQQGGPLMARLADMPDLPRIRTPATGCSGWSVITSPRVSGTKRSPPHKATAQRGLLMKKVGARRHGRSR